MMSPLKFDITPEISIILCTFNRAKHLNYCIDNLKSHPEIDLLQGGFFSEEEILVADYYEPGKTINLKECVLGPTFFGKRQVFFELKGFDNIAYGEDTDFWQRAEKVFKTHNLTDPETYIYTRAETSITKSVLEKISSLD